MITDMILVALLALVLGGASLYIYRAKKKGHKCIGCPDAPKCGQACGSCGGCAHARGQGR